MTVSPKTNPPWNELRRREFLVIFAFVGYLPFAGAFAFLVSHFTHTLLAILFVPVLWMLFVLYSWLRFMFWRCPECGKPFNTKLLGTFTRGRNCVHCGVSRYVER